ncbi:hypothetical protein [Vibrio sp. D431a]|uniref:hypothetical protein n=1 Tax=Vibrio sp. D431a TaxID=2837388 RepID=UPI0025568A4E|nr:hypothetical protein [Vibrio sp. D431a]MDK9793839.1 hypothetical protein [Vibrio sp. D431a]
MTIITDADRQVVANTSVKDQVTHNFLAPRDLAGSIITASFTDMPLIVVLSHIVPNNFELDVDTNIEGKNISWNGSKRWDGVLRDLSAENNLLVHITKSPNKVSVVSTESNAEITPVIQPVTTDVSEVVICDTADCKSGVVDIEKLVLDTSWALVEPEEEKLVLAEPSANGQSLTAEQIEAKERAEEESRIAEKREKLQLMRKQYEESYVRHGNGTFEEFVNGGGAESLKGQLDPNKTYTYVFKKGSLFTSIEKWADANGFKTRNEILAEYGKDFTNISDVYLKGNFYSVTKALLDRYKDADETPVNHKFYTQGKVLHIFVGKYN